MSMLNIAVIGAGRMGRPMVDRLVAAGYRPVVHARRPQTQAAAEAGGLRWAASIAETVRDADLVLTVVLNAGIAADHDLAARSRAEPGAIKSEP